MNYYAHTNNPYRHYRSWSIALINQQLYSHAKNN